MLLTSLLKFGLLVRFSVIPDCHHWYFLMMCSSLSFSNCTPRVYILENKHGLFAVLEMICFLKCHIQMHCSFRNCSLDMKRSLTSCFFNASSADLAACAVNAAQIDPIESLFLRSTEKSLIFRISRFSDFPTLLWLILLTPCIMFNFHLSTLELFARHIFCCTQCQKNC